MESLKAWLKKKGYEVETIALTGNRTGLKIDTDYTGLYPGKEQFEVLETVRKQVKRFYGDLTVESRGHYTAIYIY